MYTLVCLPLKIAGDGAPARAILIEDQMMRVKVRFFASVREIIGAREITAEFPDGTTVGGLWRSHVASHPRLARLRMAFAVNHEYAGTDRVLSDGDEVAVIPPVSGG